MRPFLAHGALGHGLGWTYLLLVVGIGILYWRTRRGAGDEEGEEIDAEGRRDGA
ncbi:MAG TPA: hypothetical protein VEA19_04705 [Actinomycetota bacterium]|nr:hypothetical protein [Actinomycetota bacterium]